MKTTCKRCLAVFCLALALLTLTACGSKKAQEVSAPVETPIVIYVTPVPTATPAPGTTPVPTATPVPTGPPAATQAPAPDPTATPSPTPEPTATPLNSEPVLTKSPTDESLSEGGSCMFIARADYASSIAWHFVSPDGYTDVEYSAIYDYFPDLGVRGGTETSLLLSDVPYAFNGWRVYCRFSNSLGSISSGQAVVSVSAAATPAPMPEPEHGVDIDYTTDYSGTYYDNIAGRGSMTISGSPDLYYITVSWSSSAFETSTWSFSGTFDASGRLYFYDCTKTTDTYYDEENHETTVDFTGGSGSLSSVGAGGLLWEIFEDVDVSGTVFE